MAATMTAPELEQAQTAWANGIERAEQALDSAYRTGDVDRVEELTVELRWARQQHSHITDALMALDGLVWNGSLHRWTTI